MDHPPAETGNATGAPQNRTAAGFDAGPMVSHRPRVLVADDNAGVRDALGNLLIRSGYEVSTAADGQAAVEVIKDARLDAVLLDLQMPGHDGFETLRYLQEHRRGLPVLLLSGLPADEIQERMHRLPSGLLPPLFLKPCDYDQLLTVLELMLAGDLPSNLD